MGFLAYRTGGNRIRSEQSMNADHNADHKSLETVFSFANCCQSGDKRQWKFCFVDLRSTFFDSINVFDCRLFEVFIEYTEYVVKTIRNKGYRNNLHFSCFCRKNIFVSTPDRRQSKTPFTMDERGSEIATTSVFDCHLSPVWRLMAIKILFLTILIYVRR